MVEPNVRLSSVTQTSGCKIIIRMTQTLTLQISRGGKKCCNKGNRIGPRGATPRSVPSITLYLLTCTTRCAASNSWLVWRQLKDSSGKLEPQANGCYRNRTYVHCSPSFPCHLPKYLVTLWCAPACADPVLRVKIEQYRGIHISSRTATDYSRLHLQQSSPGRVVFSQILALREHFVSRHETFKTRPRTSLFERSPPESVFIKLTSSLKARGRSNHRTLSPLGGRSRAETSTASWAVIAEGSRGAPVPKLIRRCHSLLRGVALSVCSHA